MIRPGWISDPIPVDIAQLPELLPADAVPVRLQVPASRRPGQPTWSLSSSTKSKSAMSCTWPLTGVLQRGFSYSRFWKISDFKRTFLGPDLTRSAHLEGQATTSASAPKVDVRGVKYS